jgi:hypothetical protein
VAVPPDRYDEIRRKWIARHQYIFTFQKRRAEILARQIRDRDRILTGARVDTADDDVIHPWYVRRPKTPYGMAEWVLLMVPGVLAPLGWLAGKGLAQLIVQLIPAKLRSYPIAAMLWAAAGVGTPLPLVLWLTGPGDSLLTAVMVPWLVAQIPGALLAAGLYGIAEGWLAVDGARDWWPMRPPPEVDDIDFGFLQADDLTGPGIFPTRRARPLGDASPRGRD